MEIGDGKPTIKQKIGGWLFLIALVLSWAIAILWIVNRHDFSGIIVGFAAGFMTCWLVFGSSIRQTNPNLHYPTGDIRKE